MPIGRLAPVSRLVVPKNGSETGDFQMYTDRYKAYAASRGLSADDMQAQDRFLNNGACAMNFMLWAQAKLKQYRKETGFTKFATEQDHKDYDAWLMRFAA